MTMSRCYLLNALIACLLVFNLGCSGGSSQPPLYRVQGTVLFKGEPPAGARLGFIPVNETEAAPAWAIVGDDGKFQLTTRKYLDGAQKGEYHVTVSWMKAINARSNDTDYTDELLPEKYQDPKTSNLIVQIQPKSNQLDPIVLE